MGVSNITPTRPVLPREGTSVPIMALEIMETVIFLIVVGGIHMAVVAMGIILALATIMEEIMDQAAVDSATLEETMEIMDLATIMDSVTLEETMDRLEVTTSPPGGNPPKDQPCRAF